VIEARKNRGGLLRRCRSLAKTRVWAPAIALIATSNRAWIPIPHAEGSDQENAEFSHVGNTNMAKVDTNAPVTPPSMRHS
jgi:hypothetical protein